MVTNTHSHIARTISTTKRLAPYKHWHAVEAVNGNNSSGRSATTLVSISVVLVLCCFCALSLILCLNGRAKASEKHRKNCHRKRDKYAWRVLIRLDLLLANVAVYWSYYEKTKKKSEVARIKRKQTNEMASKYSRPACVTNHKDDDDGDAGNKTTKSKQMIISRPADHTHTHTHNG